MRIFVLDITFIMCEHAIALATVLACVQIPSAQI